MGRVGPCRVNARRVVLPLGVSCRVGWACVLSVSCCVRAVLSFSTFAVHVGAARVACWLCVLKCVLGFLRVVLERVVLQCVLALACWARVRVATGRVGACRVGCVFGCVLSACRVRAGCALSACYVAVHSRRWSYSDVRSRR